MDFIYYLGIGFFWFVTFGAITSAVAKGKGFESVPWFIFGGLLFIVALPMVLILPAQAAGRSSAQKACPYCGEKINSGVLKCPACKRGQPVTATTNQNAWEKTVGGDDEVARWAREHPEQK